MLRIFHLGDCRDINVCSEKGQVTAGKFSICLEHHRTNQLFRRMNYIEANQEPQANRVSSDQTMGIDLNVEMAEAIYTAITTVRHFQYTTQRKPHIS